MTAVDREAAALVAAYDLLRDIARRHREPSAALLEADRTPEPQPEDDTEDDEDIAA